MTYEITDKFIILNKNGVKSTLLGRSKGLIAIKLKSITGLTLYSDMLVIHATGFSSPDKVGLIKAVDVKEMPNVVINRVDKLEELYYKLLEII